ncbi:hypothetical protein ACLOJK_011686 [Asimina triloba]
MSKEEGSDRSGGGCAHDQVLLVPYPTQGHINPMLQFGKRLVSKGIKVTLVNTAFINHSTQFDTGAIGVASISDGYDKGGFAEAESAEEYLERFETTGSATLSQLIFQKLGGKVSCVIYDSFLPWALQVAKQAGVLGVAFFTQLCIVDAIYYHVYHGNLAVPLPAQTASLRLPGLPPLEAADLPSFLSAWGTFPAYRALLTNQFRDVEKADGVLLNTFHELEPQAIEWMAGMLPACRAIGPTVPSAYLDKRVEGDKGYNINLEKVVGEKCIKWLDERAAGSVVYAAFGSLASLGVEEMEEVASGLKMSKQHFIWVVRESEKHKLPEGFAESTAEMGLIVTRCSQLEVLAHQAVGCFVSHCGWNSTLEALSLGVPVVAAPFWSDQTTNAKCLEDLWKVGVRARADEKGIVRKEELEFRIKQVMGGEGRDELKENARKWRELARTAVDEGGSSDKSIDEFVAVINVKA